MVYLVKICQYFNCSQSNSLTKSNIKIHSKMFILMQKIYLCIKCTPNIWWKKEFSKLDKIWNSTTFFISFNNRDWFIKNLIVQKLGDSLSTSHPQILIQLYSNLRFAAKPIFSAHTNGSKHKYERFWRDDEMIGKSNFQFRISPLDDACL